MTLATRERRRSRTRCLGDPRARPELAGRLNTGDRAGEIGVSVVETSTDGTPDAPRRAVSPRRGSLAKLSVTRFGGEWGLSVATLILWVGLLAPFAYGLTRSRPTGLLTFRSQDVPLGHRLRNCPSIRSSLVGWRRHDAVPRSPLIVGSPGVMWLVGEAFPLGVIGPMTEELFFRAVGSSDCLSDCSGGPSDLCQPGSLPS